MTGTPLHSIPSMGQVIREQFRTVAQSLRLPITGVAALSVIVSMLALADFARGHGGVEFAPELSMIPAFAGALLPIAVWQSEKRFGNGFLWTLPVDRVRHAFAKVLAGWLVLMIAVFLFVAWLLVLALITKGNITGDETIRLLPSPMIPPRGDLDLSQLRTITWIPPRVLWLTPFFAATGAYALASGIMLGLRHPLRWLVGIVAAGFFAAAVGHGLGDEMMDRAVGGLAETILFGRFGVDGLLSARTESLKTIVQLSNGEWADVWRAVPDLSDWIIATLLWTGLGVAGLVAAVMRHRERR